MAQEPMIQLEPGGKAPLLSYNVPEPSSYSGQNIIELEFPKNWFNKKCSAKPPAASRTVLKGADLDAVKSAVESGMKSGFADKKLFPNIKLAAAGIKFSEKPNPGLGIVSTVPVSSKLAKLDPEEVARNIQSGSRLNIYKSLYGTLTYNFIPEPAEARPRLLLVETYRFSSFLGSYGAGKTIKTFSLLPGEKTRISIKTYTKTESESKSASSILDSFTQESADDFESSVQSEQSDKQSSSENFEYHAEAEAQASWGWGSAKVSGGVKGGTNSSREEFAKNVSSATEKHSAKASAKRDVQVNTSFEVKEQSGEETSIEREIQNINVSRTLNFVFRQMNQEFVSILHLVDIRLAFFNGYAESRREVSLPDMDKLLEEVLVDKTKCDEAKKAIVEQLQNIFDYKDNHHSFVEEKAMKDKNGADIPGTAYLRVKKDYISVYKDSTSGTEVSVPGIILAAKKSVLRTDGVIIEALLGQGNALDEYSSGLQDEAVKQQKLKNEILKTELEKNKLALKIIENKDEKAAEVFSIVYPPEIREGDEDGGT